MENYRDYGTIGGIGVTDTPINTVRYGQVYQATHDGKQRLPYMNRSFISFTYGNKHIEDFDLLATITSNRLSRDGYASFKDNVSTYDNLDGQFYWNTHYANNTITFNLATDGIDQRKLDNFLSWFSAGVSRELVLSEHPNRAIMARVSKPPAISLLPFESIVEMNIAGEIYKTKTTLYKGEITLELISDDPHWYAINNILGKKSGDRYIDQWTDANGNDVSIFASQDALKILYEDGIPLGSMIENDMLLGNGAFAKVEDNVEQLIWSPEANDEDIIWSEDGIPSGEGARIDGIRTDEEYWYESEEVMTNEEYEAIKAEDEILIKFDKPTSFIRTRRECAPGDYIGRIAGAIIDASGKGILELDSGSYGYFFYAGTAPSPTIISFDIPSQFDDNGYLCSITNEIMNPNQSYSSLYIESVRKQELRLGAPNVISSYNIALNLLLTNYFSSISIPDLKELIIDKVKHPAVRAWTNALIDSTERTTTITSTDVKDRMKNFWMNDDDTYTSFHFSFNSKTGEAGVTYNYRKARNRISFSDILYEPNAVNKINTISAQDSSLTDKQRYENLVTWGWSVYCIQNDILIVPTEEEPSSYTQAITAFISYLSSCISNKKALPTIFMVNNDINASSLLIHVKDEDAGDMLKSNNIIIHERNYPNKEGRFLRWDYTEEARTYSHRIYHNLSVPIQNLQILYRNMYL